MYTILHMFFQAPSDREKDKDRQVFSIWSLTLHFKQTLTPALSTMQKLADEKVAASLQA